MGNIVAALLRGFWQRLTGYLSAARRPTAERVQALAADTGTGVTLSRDESARLLDLAQRGREAAESYVGGTVPHAGTIPAVPLPPTPNIDGGAPGRYEVGLIIRPADGPGSRGGADINVTYSTDNLSPLDSIISDLQDYIENCGGEGCSPTEFVGRIIQNWRHGNKTYILPNWLIERIEGVE